MKKYLTYFLFCVFVMFSAITAEAACRCESNIQLPPISELQKMDAVFAGEVIDIKPKPESKNGIEMLWVSFKVEDVYKGSVSSEACILTPKEAGSCGYEFKKGEKYLIYARQKDGVLVVDTCTRTKTYSKALNEGDINQFSSLGLGHKVENEVFFEQDIPKDLMQRYPVLEDLQKSDAVFMGPVLSVEAANDGKGSKDAVLSPNFVYKGWLNWRVSVRTPDAAKGGINFVTGQQYFVFGKYINGILYTDSRTKTNDFFHAGNEGLFDQMERFAERFQWFGGSRSQESSPKARRYIEEILHNVPKTVNVYYAIYNTLDFTRLLESLKGLVKSYYPDAMIKMSNNGYYDDAMHFEYNTQYYEFTGPAQLEPSGKNFNTKYVANGPKKGGIVGSVCVYYMNTGPLTYRMSLGPFSSENFNPGHEVISYGKTISLGKFPHCHLYIHVIYPQDPKGIEFRDKFIAIADNFDNYVDINPEFGSLMSHINKDGKPVPFAEDQKELILKDK